MVQHKGLYEAKHHETHNSIYYVCRHSSLTTIFFTSNLSNLSNLSNHSNLSNPLKPFKPLKPTQTFQTHSNLSNHPNSLSKFQRISCGLKELLTFDKTFILYYADITQVGEIGREVDFQSV